MGQVARLAHAVPGDPPQIMRGENDRILLPVAGGAEKSVGPVRLAHPFRPFPSAVGIVARRTGHGAERRSPAARVEPRKIVGPSGFATFGAFPVLGSPRMAPPAQGPPRIAAGIFPPVDRVAFEAPDYGSGSGPSVGFSAHRGVAPETALRVVRSGGKQRGSLHRGVHLVACPTDDLPRRSHQKAFPPDRLRKPPLRYLLENGMREREPSLFTDRVLGLVAFETGVRFGRPEERRSRRSPVHTVAPAADLATLRGRRRHVRSRRAPRLDVGGPSGGVAPAAQLPRADILPAECPAPFSRLRVERVTRGARFFARVGRTPGAGVSSRESMAGNASGDGAGRVLPAPVDRVALQAAGKGCLAALPDSPALERVAPGARGIDRCVATAAKGASGLPEEGFPESAVGLVTIRASRLPGAPRVKSPRFRRVVRMASGADGAPALPQGNARPGQDPPPPLDVGGVACGASSPTPFSRRQGGVLGPLPKDGAVVPHGSVVATAADPLLVERLYPPGCEKGRIEEDAFTDVAERTVLLVESGTGSSRSFEKQRQRQREEKDPFFQPAPDPMVRRRPPS